jgi:hypothetical protein
MRVMSAMPGAIAGPVDPTPRIDPGWFDLLRQVTARSAVEHPLLTLVVIAATMVIIVVGPIWIVSYYGYLSLSRRQQERFTRIRRGSQP